MKPTGLSIWRALRAQAFDFPVCHSCRRWIATGRLRVTENDTVLLRRKDDLNAGPIFTGPLTRGKKVQSHTGNIGHDEIIGKEIRDVVRTSRGKEYRIYQPTLAEYVTLTPRIVTPIYPADANLIVSLLDIHVTPPEPGTEDEAGPLEILEAGTGHGALTLHLARAISAANGRSPKIPPLSAQAINKVVSKDHVQDPIEDADASNDALEGTSSEEVARASPEEEAYEQWKRARSAIIHTVDASAERSAHAERIVRGFRHGIYAGNVDYHVGDASQWIKEQFQTRHASSGEEPGKAEPFLSHVILDLPGTHHHLDTVSQALRVNGALAVFNPSITQITSCVQKIRQQRLPLVLEQVVELGAGSTGGREWDVRAVRPRVLDRMQAQPASDSSDGESTANGQSPNEAQETEKPQTTDSREDGWEMVCRPKVGARVVGGGFLAIWKRMKPTLTGE
ncbi:S-adenosyl-L-methionine-dependent methyltransferase [Xylona heveae TC161]|uniref:tRNA (adenine(58)-N(1))-methyltransferase catalytic subunit TRM61 n=1 Tax=Xylona heveae (strain CBS 132557 / TC161) TaxID=1328760 RepID=A0A165IKD3_XYLHT|nr:S-adenosyl-L-methionine-dependent methyltransferase [Xylona heveae TC161]KZF25020.1 S-adenosyl-L-methionine-dependent methyltransferase [Xylona heveae TC161]